MINACNLTQLVTVNICYFIVNECGCAAKADFVGIRRKLTYALGFGVRILLHLYPDWLLRRIWRLDGTILFLGSRRNFAALSSRRFSGNCVSERCYSNNCGCWKSERFFWTSCSRRLRVTLKFKEQNFLLWYAWLKNYFHLMGAKFYRKHSSLPKELLRTNRQIQCLKYWNTSNNVAIYFTLTLCVVETSLVMGHLNFLFCDQGIL